MNGNSVQNINFILQYQSSGALYVPELTQVSLNLSVPATTRTWALCPSHLCSLLK